MKILLVILIIPSVLVSFCFPTYAEVYPYSDDASVLICAENGAVLHEHNADSQLPIASLTKIMTAVIVIESLSLDETVTIDKRACGVEGSSVYLTAGESLSVSDLLYAMMLRSANDAAAALAYAVSGSIEGFAKLMNDKAESLDMVNTHFANPHGLDSEDHYSSARDLAKLTEYALSLPDFADVVSTRSRYIPYEDDPKARYLINHNKLLGSYEGCIGVKTGYTLKCGRCLVSAAVRDGITLICVTLNDPDDWKDHAELLDMGFDSLIRIPVPYGDKLFNVNVVSGVSCNAVCSADKDYIIADSTFADDIEATVCLKRFYYAPLHAGERVGSLLVFGGGSQIAEIGIRVLQNVPEISYGKSLFEKILWFFGIKSWN